MKYGEFLHQNWIQVCARLWAGFCSNMGHVDFRCWYAWQGTKDFGYLDSTCSTVGSWVSQTPRCALMYLSSEVTVSITPSSCWLMGSELPYVSICVPCFWGWTWNILECDLNLQNSHECWCDLRVQWSPHPYRLADCWGFSECEKQNVTTSEFGMWVYGVYSWYSWKFVPRPRVFMSRSQLHHACQNLKPFGGIDQEKLGTRKPNIPRSGVSGVVSPMLPEWNLGSRCRGCCCLCLVPVNQECSWPQKHKFAFSF